LLLVNKSMEYCRLPKEGDGKIVASTCDEVKHPGKFVLHIHGHVAVTPCSPRSVRNSKWFYIAVSGVRVDFSITLWGKYIQIQFMHGASLSSLARGNMRRM